MGRRRQIFNAEEQREANRQKSRRYYLKNKKVCDEKALLNWRKNHPKIEKIRETAHITDETPLEERLKYFNDDDILPFEWQERLSKQSEQSETNDEQQQSQ